MRLKQLKLAGFKSFANPTTFHFPKTITAIVGPNGCGKSNVIDAIRWVLGESSAKQLRGGAMSDVIFAGTQEKSAKSLASVELVFEHTQGDDGKSSIHHVLNLYHELSVRRQISKDGKSDYFINGTKVRRRDVVDVFLGTGLGARSYAVIEQGMIGRIIDANALQLREFIEEASGVSRYQSRRDDTQKQLDTAKDNLSRLSDMVSELTVQQNRLEKQAKTAQQAQAWQAELDSITQQLLIDDYGQAWQKQQNLAKEFDVISEQVTAQQVVLSEYTNLLQNAQHKISDQQLAHQNAQNLAQRHWQQHFETQNLLTQSEKTLANQHNRFNTLNFELNRLADYQAELIKQKAQAQATIDDLPEQIDSLDRELNTVRDELYHLKRQREHIAAELVTLNRQKTDLEKTLAVSENAIKHFTNQREQRTRREQNHTYAMTAWQMAKAKFETDFAATGKGDFDEKISQLGNQIDQLEKRIITRQEEIADQTDEVESLTRQYRQAEQQRHTWLTEQATLQNLLDQLYEKEKQVQKSAKQREQTVSNNMTILPRLAENLTLTEQGKAHVETLDNVLGLMANWAIFDGNFDNGTPILDQFNHAFTLLSQAKSSDIETDTLVNWLKFSDLIQCPNMAIFERIWLYDGMLTNIEFEQIFSQLQPYLVKNWLLIQVEATLYLLSNTMVINVPALIDDINPKDPKRYAPPTLDLSQKIHQQARIDELVGLLNNQKPQFDRLAHMLQEATVSLQEWQAQDRFARNELLALTQQKQRLQQDKLQHEHRYQSALDKLELDKKRLDSEAGRLAEEWGGFDENLAKEQQNLAKIHHDLATLQPQLQQKISERQDHDERMNALTTRQRELEQQNSRHTQNLATGQLQIRASEQQLAKANDDKQRLEQEHKQLSEQLAEQKAHLPKLQQQLAEQTILLEQAKQGVAKLAQELAELQTQLQNQQQQGQIAQIEFDNLQQQRHRLDTAVALAQQTVDLIGEQLNEKEVELPAIHNLVLLEKGVRKHQQTQAETLKQRISELGAVNYSAMAELEEVNQRLIPLAEQISDLTASGDKLLQAIQQIDSQTKQLFMDMLNEVNIELNHLFTQVFGGGQAQLVLSQDGEKGWQSGLELMAQPKGKKNSRLALLSGGEKTLTALSLVFAIFKQQPAPFCVLDEVDAPLDDANVERFTHLIHELAKDVQFIFISHNKLAMQIADELKGVTMPTPGVSKLVSVDMSEVGQYLESP